MKQKRASTSTYVNGTNFDSSYGASDGHMWLKLVNPSHVFNHRQPHLIIPTCKCFKCFSFVWFLRYSCVVKSCSHVFASCGFSHAYVWLTRVNFSHMLIYIRQSLTRQRFTCCTSCCSLNAHMWLKVMNCSHELIHLVGNHM